MKNRFKICFILMCFFMSVLQSCMEDNSDDVQSAATSIAFTLDETIPNPSSITGHDLLVTVEDVSGKVILLNHRLSFTETGGSFTAEELKLPPGTYVITDLRLDKGDETIYDAAGDHADAQIKNIMSLPYRFTVSSEKKNELAFKMKPSKAKDEFSVAVWTDGSDGPEYIRATAYLKDGDRVVAVYSLLPKLNYLTFNLDRKKTYTLLVFKTGFTSVSQPFVFHHMRNKPINITLSPIAGLVTMKGKSQPTEDNDNIFQFELWAAPGWIDADFGAAGAIGIRFDEITQWQSFGLLNTEPQEYEVIVTGSLDKVTKFIQDHGGLLSELDLSGFINLQEIRMVYHPITSLDISANTKLEILSLAAMTELVDVTLPSDHFIRHLNIPGDNALPTAEIDELIGNIYANAISKNIDNGIVNISTEGDGGVNILGPPSESSFTKLRDLRDNHGWTIIPDIH